MPNIFTKEYAQEAVEALRRAAEEARKAKRRADLLAQINDWNGKLSGVMSQISGLESEKHNLETYLGEWEGQKSIYNGNEILSEVVIVNLFEGVCADEMKNEFTEAVNAMDLTCKGVDVMRGDIGAQISRLHQYKSLISTNLKSLHNELRSI